MKSPGSASQHGFCGRDRMTPELEHEFLIRLAPVYLACRWRVMGHSLSGRCWPKPDLAFDLLGLHDYGFEMRLLMDEAISLDSLRDLSPERGAR